jgi:type II secretory pathway pseudopilin PulG
MIANHRRPGRARLGPVLVSVIIVLICAGVLIPSVSHLRQTARRMSCQFNYWQIGLAIHNYHDVNGRLPTATMPNEKLLPEKRLSWLFTILPYVEAADYYRRAKHDAAWDDESNQYSTGFSHPIYNCQHVRSRKDNPITTTYRGISGVGADSATFPIDHPDAGIFGYDRTVKLSDISDTASTLMILETNTGGPWAQGGHSTVRGIEPTTALGKTTPFGSTHRSGGLFSSNVGANICMADGSGRFIQHTVDPNVLMMLARIRGEKNAAWE